MARWALPVLVGPSTANSGDVTGSMRRSLATSPYAVCGWLGNVRRNMFVLGIGGGTGSGKTTVAQKLVGGVPPGAAVIIDHDAYYRDRSGLPPAERERINYD